MHMFVMVGETGAPGGKPSKYRFEPPALSVVQAHPLPIDLFIPPLLPPSIPISMLTFQIQLSVLSVRMLARLVLWEA